MVKTIFFLLLLPSVALGNSTARIRSYQPSDFSMSLTATDTPRVTSSASSTVQTTNGRAINVYTAPSTKHDQQINVSTSGTYALNEGAITYTSSLAGSGNTISTSGYLTHATDGTDTVIVRRTNPAFATAIRLPLVTTTSTVSTFMNWAAQTPPLLPADFNSEIDTRLATAGAANGGAFSYATATYGATGGNMGLFSSVNDSTGAYTRNPSVWTGTIDLSAVSVYSGGYAGYGAAKQAVSLITPSDVIMCQHFGYATSEVFTFVDEANSVFRATLQTITVVNGDLEIGHLTWNSGTTPTTLKPLQVLPANYQHYCPDHNLNDFPVVMENQNRQVFVQDSANGTTITPAFDGASFNHNPSTETNRAPYTLAVVVGDSSLPVMAIVNGTAVVLCCSTSYTYGVSVSDNLSAINTALAAYYGGDTGASHQLTIVNLAAFQAAGAAPY